MKDLGALLLIDWIKWGAFLCSLPILYAVAVYFFGAALAKRFQVPRLKVVLVAVGMFIPISYVIASLGTVKVACLRAGPAFMPERVLLTNGVRLSGGAVFGVYVDDWPRGWTSSDTRPWGSFDKNVVADYTLVTKDAQPHVSFLNTYQSETTISRVKDDNVVARRLEFFAGGGLFGSFLMLVNGTPFIGCSQTHPDLQTWQSRGLIGVVFSKRNPNRPPDLVIPLQNHDEYFIFNTLARAP